MVIPCNNVVILFKKKNLKDQNFEDSCISVVQAGDLQALKNLLSGQRKVDINTPIGGMGLTFLHLCAVFNQIELATFLLEKNTKVNKRETLSRKTPSKISSILFSKNERNVGRISISRAFLFNRV